MLASQVISGGAGMDAQCTHAAKSRGIAGVMVDGEIGDLTYHQNAGSQ